MITPSVTSDVTTKEKNIAQHSHKLLSIFGKRQNSFLSHRSTKILCNTYRPKNSLMQAAKKQRSFPTCFFSGDKNIYHRQLLTSRTRMCFVWAIQLRNSLKNNQCICKAWSVETILRQSSIKDKTDRGWEWFHGKRKGGPGNFFHTASLIAVAFGPSLEITPCLNSPYVSGDSQNQLIQSCAKEARDTSSQICWLLSRATWWSRCQNRESKPDYSQPCC